VVAEYVIEEAPAAEEVVTTLAVVPSDVPKFPSHKFAELIGVGKVDEDGVDNDHWVGFQIVDFSAGKPSVHMHHAQSVKFLDVYWQVFPSDENYVRGVAVTDVLLCCASVMSMEAVGATASNAWWATRQVFEKTSKPMQGNTLHTFISHTWRSARKTKYLQLTLYFSTVPAAVAMVVAACAGAAVDISTEALPKLTFTNGDPMYISPVLLGVPVYYGVLIFAWDLAKLFRLGRWAPKVFLDKFCINQADESEKKCGVDALATLTKDSQSMLILYTDDYLTRLWTIFEVALFLATHRPEDIVMVPEFLPKVIFGGSLCAVGLQVVVANMLTCKELGLSADWEWPKYVALFFVALAGCVGFTLLRRWLAEVQNMKRSMSKFDIRCCEVTNPFDRNEIYRKIVALERCISHTYEATARLPPGASEEEALAHFSRRIAFDMPRLVQQQFGRNGIPYAFIMAMYFPYILLTFGRVSAAVQAPSAAMIFTALYDLVHLFCVFPIAVAVCSVFARSFLPIGTWKKELCLMCVSIVVVIAASVGVDAVLFVLTYNARNGIIYPFFSIIYSIILGRITYKIFRAVPAVEDGEVKEYWGAPQPPWRGVLG
jgi:hypothetical protein